jgi:hypothetical protein
MNETGLTPAAITAAMKGDLANFLVAATPGGIERQEAAGQQALVKSTNMPKEMRPHPAAYEKVGFKFGDAVDDVFIAAELPPGWTRRATDHSMWSEILDGRGRVRVSVFYKAAFYDRKAHADMDCRFTVCSDFDSDGNLAAELVKDAGTEVARFGVDVPRDQHGDSAAYQAVRAAQKEADALAEAWLAERYPNHADPTAYWDEP